MTPEQEFDRWYKYFGKDYILTMIRCYLDNPQALDITIRKVFIDGYSLACSPTERTEPCTEELPLCAFGPGSACR